MRFWLLKSEPDAFSWEDLMARGSAGEEWNGVRNYQARNMMREMALGDRAFFYHTQKDKAIVGICEVIALAHPDSTSTDPRWDCVDVRARASLPRPVTLADCKAEPRLAGMALVRAPRLSVQPVSADEWALICDMGGVTP
ncbi:MAG: EVE domain-containing protein [Rhodobacteraceae bacterium]|nr:MAG: EVE domain-containing protein [Paracoccaceae bacterium]